MSYGTDGYGGAYEHAYEQGRGYGGAYQQGAGYGGEDVVEEVVSALVRPYALTGGRTRARYHLALEALVVAEVGAVRDLGAVAPEYRAILELCHPEWRSVAEIAALCDIPLGVARILIADLLHEGLVHVYQTQTAPGGKPEIELLERVLSGLRNL